MKDQVASLKKRGIAAACIGPESTATELDDIKNGKYNLVFGSPEALLNYHRTIFRSEYLKDFIKAVFVDESHCIAKWGKDQGTTEAFRSDYGRLGELRSLLRKEVPFVSLTATATRQTKMIIIKDLCMKDCVEVLSDPNRPHTRYSVVEIDATDLHGSFSWLIEELEQKQQNTAKVIVFCRRKEHMKELYELFSQYLGGKAYYTPTGEEPKDDRSRLFAMYHKRTDKLVKETIEREFCKADGTVRVLFCSIAFGMGVNVKNVFLDLHLGPSGDLDDYLQETGRVGRDSTQMSHAVLLKYKGCCRSRNISKDMRNYVKNTTVCRREMLLSHFSSTIEKERVLHCCCDVCAKECRCMCSCSEECCSCLVSCNKDNTCNYYITRIEKQLKGGQKQGSDVKTKVSLVPQERLVKVRENLLQYRSDLASNVTDKSLLVTGIDIATGYSRHLVDDIISNINYIKDKEYLRSNFAFYSDKHVDKTWEIIHSSLSSPESYVAQESDSESVDFTDASTNSLSDNDSDMSFSSDSTIFRAKKLHGIISSEEESSTESES